MSEKFYAVLTGDIVKSRELSANQSKALQNRLKSTAQEFESVFPGSVVGALGITRGDGWQVALQKPEYALRLALFLRVIVKSEFKTDTRVSIGIGPVDRLEPNNIIESTGLAFERSGHGLESISAKRFLVFNTGKIADRIQSAELLLVEWLDTLLSCASVAQVPLLTLSLLEHKQVRIAQVTGYAQSTVSEGLAAAGWGQIKGILHHFEKYR
ncbi:MAG: hypothetical protein ISR84_00245 [Kiritimatiellales bacterium]|nr:hypothetical protein [Kiritimatiellota bacterium]MBL7015965.1 hypothetical protein [Kiritimatiellales bacterium]